MILQDKLKLLDEMPDEQIMELIEPLLNICHSRGISMRKLVYHKLYSDEGSGNARYYIHLGQFKERKGKKSNRPTKEKARKIVEGILEQLLSLTIEVDQKFNEVLSTPVEEADDFFDF